MKRWRIYHKNQEYTWGMNDTVLGTVAADTEQEAKEIAAKFIGDPASSLSVIQDDQSRCDYCHNLTPVRDITRGKTVAEVCPTCREMDV